MQERADSFILPLGTKKALPVRNTKEDVDKSSAREGRVTEGRKEVVKNGDGDKKDVRIIRVVCDFVIKELWL